MQELYEQELCVQDLCVQEQCTGVVCARVVCAGAGVHSAALILRSLLVLVVSSHTFLNFLTSEQTHLLESPHYLSLLWPLRHSRLSLFYCYLCVSDTSIFFLSRMFKHCISHREVCGLS